MKCCYVVMIHRNSRDAVSVMNQLAGLAVVTIRCTTKMMGHIAKSALSTGNNTTGDERGRMPLTTEEKSARARQRLIETAKQYQSSTYSRKFVAPTFQDMIRAEWAALCAGYEYAIVKGELVKVARQLGQCVCVTCGKVERWNSGIHGMHSGHFLASRRNSILFEETNVAPQCCHCNYHLSGNPQAFRAWMIAVRGDVIIERLERLKTESRTFSRDELVDMRIEYSARLKAAIERMQG